MSARAEIEWESRFDDTGTIILILLSVDRSEQKKSRCSFEFLHFAMLELGRFET